MSSNSSTYRFVALSGGVFVFYLAYGYLLELLFRAGLKPFGWYITMVQFGCYTMLAAIDLRLRRIQLSSTPLVTFGGIALLTVTTMAGSNISLQYLNYPTQVVFKSCKLIPVMIGGVLIQNKRYSKMQVAAVLCLCLGLSIFTLAGVEVTVDGEEEKGEGEEEAGGLRGGGRKAYFGKAFWGIFYICGALVADAAIGNVQERVMNSHKVGAMVVVNNSNDSTSRSSSSSSTVFPNRSAVISGSGVDMRDNRAATAGVVPCTNTEMVYRSYSIGFVILLIVNVLNGQFFSGQHAFAHLSLTEGYGAVAAFSVAGYLGVSCVLSLVKTYGALNAVIVTSVRKAATLCLSFVVFPKPFHTNYLIGALLVFCGIGLNVYAKEVRKHQHDSWLGR